MIRLKTRVTGSADDISDYCLLTLSTLTDREKDLFAGGSGASISGTMMDNIWWFIGIGVIVWLAGWIQTATLMYSADRQVNFLRKWYTAHYLISKKINIKDKLEARGFLLYHKKGNVFCVDYAPEHWLF